ncbi:MAG: hypothetical protein ABEJ05_01405, partial [Haloglomus sp.]
AWFSNAFTVVTIYFAGAITTLWALFSAVASFKTRNDPGGTVELRVTEGGETRVVEVSNRGLAQKLGGIGLLGSTPDGDVATQTAGSTASSGSTTDDGREPDAQASSDGNFDGGAEVMSSNAGADDGPESLTEQARSGAGRNQRHAGRADAAGATSDGGTTTDDAEFLSADADPHPNQDLYCGNCAHFRYVRTDQGMQPYCGLHGEVMDDMDACKEWTPNNQ